MAPTSTASVSSMVSNLVIFFIFESPFFDFYKQKTVNPENSTFTAKDRFRSTGMTALHFRDSPQDVLLTAQPVHPGSAHASAVCPFPFAGSPVSITAKATRQAAPLSILVYAVTCTLYHLTKLVSTHKFTIYPYFQYPVKTGADDSAPVSISHDYALRKRDRKFLVSCFWGLPNTSSGAPSSQMTPSFI